MKIAGLSAEAKAGNLFFPVGIVLGWGLVLLLLCSKDAAFFSFLVPRHLVAHYVQVVVALIILGLILAMAAVYCSERMHL